MVPHADDEREHGTYGMYELGCRCAACHAAHRRWRYRQRAYGRAVLVDAGPAREHVQACQRAGVGWRRVARLAGVSRGAVSRLLYGRGSRPPSRRVHPSTETALFAVTVPTGEETSGHGHVDATGTRRRLQGWVAAGWSQRRLAGLLGMHPRNFAHLLHDARRVRLATHRQVQALCAADLPAPEGTHRERIAASRARRYAAGRGWAPLLAWDEDIDRPDAVPHGHRVCACRGCAGGIYARGLCRRCYRHARHTDAKNALRLGR